jgi:hypothetical protein
MVIDYYLKNISKDRIQAFQSSLGIGALAEIANQEIKKVIV